MPPRRHAALPALASILAASLMFAFASARAEDKPATEQPSTPAKADAAPAKATDAAPAKAPDAAPAKAADPAPAKAADPAPAAGSAAPTPASAPGGVSELRIVDMKEGTGRQVEKGKAAFVHYVGWLYDPAAQDNKGKEFDNSATRGLPFGFIVGVGRVIKGWDEGLLGMKIGGKRKLVVPAAMAYGDKDIGNGLIPPNSPLVFEIELVDIKP